MPSETIEASSHFLWGEREGGGRKDWSKTNYMQLFL